MGKTTAQKGPNVVKDGARLEDVYATAVGDITKAYFLMFALEDEKNVERSGLESSFKTLRRFHLFCVCCLDRLM